MEEIKLDVQVRKEVGSGPIRKIRNAGLIPAVVYGGKKKPTVVKVDRRNFEKIRRQHVGEQLVFHINVLEGEKKLRDYSAIVKEEQHDPLSNEILHIDFNRISLTEKIEIKVPIAAKGEPVGVKRDGGSLDHVMWELDIICLPTNIPQHIDIDVSALEIGDSVHVSDIKLPEGVETHHDPESVVFHVVPPMKEEEPEEAEEGEEPEVIGEKKEKAEGEEAEKAEEKGEAKKEEKGEAKDKEEKK